jgi:hypothetical protein
MEEINNINTIIKELEFRESAPSLGSINHLLLSLNFCLRVPLSNTSFLRG